MFIDISTLQDYNSLTHAINKIPSVRFCPPSPCVILIKLTYRPWNQAILTPHSVSANLVPLLQSQYLIMTLVHSVPSFLFVLFIIYPHSRTPAEFQQAMTVEDLRECDDVKT